MMTTSRVFTVRFLVELLVVGFLTVLFGYVSGYLVSMMSGKNSSDFCMDWLKNHLMVKTLFLTGVLMHFTMEVTGFHKWYHGQIARLF